MDRFSRICLASIVLLLSVIAFRPVLSPPPVHASPRFTEYDVFVADQTQVDSIAKVLKKGSGAGWEVIGVTSIPDFHNGAGAVLILLAR